MKKKRVMAVLMAVVLMITTAFYFAPGVEAAEIATPTDIDEGYGVFDHAYTDVDTSGMDFSSCELLVKTADPSIFTKNTNVVSNLDEVYMLQFDTREETESAYTYYMDKAELVEPNEKVFAISTEAPEEDTADLTDLNTGEDALAEAAALPDVSLRGAAALIDTGASGSNVIKAVSVLGGETADDNGHGTRMRDAVIEVNPDARILSIKALDANGTAKVADIYAAIAYAIDSDVSVINLSIASRRSAESELITGIIKEAAAKGIIVVGAGGNQGRNAADYIPGCIDDALVAGACDENGVRLPSSNYGATVDYNVVAQSTSEAAAKLTGLVTKYGADKLPINEGIIFTTDYQAATQTDAEPVITTTEVTTTEETATEAAATEETTTEISTTEVTTTTETTETETSSNAGAWGGKDILDNLFHAQGSCASYVSSRLGLNPGYALVSDLRQYLINNGYYVKGYNGDYDTSTIAGSNALAEAVKSCNPVSGDIIIFYETVANGYDDANAMTHVGIINTTNGSGTINGGLLSYPSYDYDSVDDNNGARINKSIANWVHYATGEKQSRGFAVWSNQQRYGTLQVIKSIEGTQSWSSASDISGASYGVFRSAADAQDGTNPVAYCAIKPSAAVGGIAFNNMSTYANSDINGNGNAVSLEIGQYYVREVKIPDSEYWKADMTVYGPFNVQAGKSLTVGVNPINYDGTSVSVNVTSDMIFDYTEIGPEQINPGTIQVIKSIEGTQSWNSTSDISGASYGVYPSYAEAESGTNAYGYCAIKSSDTVGGIAFNNMSTYINSDVNGNGSAVMLNPGTVCYVKEAQTPSSGYWQKDTKVYGPFTIKAGKYTTIGVNPINYDGSAVSISVNSTMDFNYTEIGPEKIVRTSLSIEKSSAMPDVTTGNACYSLQGAKYNVYAGSSATGTPVATLVTDADGKASVDNLLPGQYTVKEAEAPKGFAIDTKEYPVTTSATQPVLLRVSDWPNMDPVSILLEKKNVKGAGIADAQYTIKFYKGVKLDTDPAQSGIAVDRTWVFKTDETGKIRFSNNQKWFVSGDEFYTYFGAVAMPEGTVTIQETSAPVGYVLDPTVYVRQITPGTDASVSTFNEPTVTEQTTRGDLAFTKKNEDGTKLANVKFLLKNDDSGESHIIWTDENGYYSTASSYILHSQNTNRDEKGCGIWFGDETLDDSRGALPYGTYTLKELRCPANKNTYKDIQPVTFTITENDQLYEVGDIINYKFPTLTTKAINSETGLNVAYAIDGETFAGIDTVSLKDLEIGHEYMLTMKAYSTLTGTYVAEDQKSFNAAQANMDVNTDVRFKLSADMAGTDIKIFEYLTDSAYPDETIAIEEDLNNEQQTIHFTKPSMGTTFLDDTTGTHMAYPGEKVKHTDKIAYTNLIPGIECKAKATLKYQDTGETVVDADGNELVKEIKFTPEEPDGAAYVTFEFNASLLAGKSITAFEEIYVKDRLMMSECDLNNEDQTITYDTPPTTEVTTTEVTTTEETTTEITTTEETTTEITTTEVTTTTEITTTETEVTPPPSGPPTTGDKAPVSAVVLIFVAAAAGLVILGVVKKKKLK